MPKERRQFLVHNSKIVLYLDYSNLEGEAYVQLVEDSIVQAKRNETVDKRLILVNTTDSVVDKTVLQALKRLTRETSGDISKIAVFGLSGLQTFFLNTISRLSKSAVKPFNNREEALEWLTSE